MSAQPTVDPITQEEGRQLALVAVHDVAMMQLGGDGLAPGALTHLTQLHYEVDRMPNDALRDAFRLTLIRLVWNAVHQLPPLAHVDLSDDPAVQAVLDTAREWPADHSLTQFARQASSGVSELMDTLSLLVAAAVAVRRLLVAQLADSSGANRQIGRSWRVLAGLAATTTVQDRSD